MNYLVFNSKQTKVLLPSCFLFVFLFTLMFAKQVLAETEAGTDTHQSAYLDALDTVIAADMGIREGMSRISDGTVAHFDFLQNEHIELLRHASALRHPPTRLAPGERPRVIALAEALFSFAESLELVIADFLRAQALLGSAVSSTLDLLATQSKQRLSNAEQSSFQQLASSARKFRTNNTPESRKALYAAFDEVAALRLNQTLQSELLVQRTLIQNNANEAAAGLGRVAAAELTPLAGKLKATYLAALTN
jgi:hypothetical protein